MIAYFAAPVRALLIVAVLLAAVRTADAGAGAPAPTSKQTATEGAKAAPPATNDDVPLDGLLIIAGVIGLVVIIAWVASRVGENRSHVIG